MREEHLFGRHPVLEALRASRPVEKVFIQDGIQDVDIVREIKRHVREEHIPFSVVSKAVLDRLSQNGNHQGVVASVAHRDYTDFDVIVARAREQGQEPRILVLDEIQDPRNLGSLLRSAGAAGFHGAVVTERRAAGLTGSVSKAAAGADAFVPVAKVGNMSNFLEEQARAGFHIIGADASAHLDFRQARYPQPLILVMGGESKGLGRLVRQKCHQVVRIPMGAQVESLNVSVAGALLMYEAVRAQALAPRSEGGEAGQ